MNTEIKAAATEAEPLIRMRAITKVFYTDEIETHALSGVHCDIRSGEFVSISGPSGCGKSTLLAILGSARYAFRWRVLPPRTIRSRASVSMSARPSAIARSASSSSRSISSAISRSIRTWSCR